jgi:hypothetical protein
MMVWVDPARRPDHHRVAPLLFLTSALFVAYAFSYHTSDASVLLLPALLLLALFFAPALRPLGVAAVALPVLLLLLNFHNLEREETAVRPLAESILAAAPQEAIVLTPGDRSIFTLWYFQHVEKRRPDLILVDSNLFAFSWYRQRLAEQYPTLRGLAADDLRTFRQTNEIHAPFCLASMVATQTAPPGLSCR